MYYGLTEDQLNLFGVETFFSAKDILADLTKTTTHYLIKILITVFRELVRL